MTSRDFCFWLQGFFELQPKGQVNLTAEQSDLVRRHLALVFQHEIDPSFGDKEIQDALNHLHGDNTGNIVVRC